MVSHRNLAAAYDTGFLDDLVTPFPRPRARPEPSRRLERRELAKLKPVFGGEDGTMTARNSTPLSDGASAVLLAARLGGGSQPAGPAYIVDAQTAAVDHVHAREGLLWPRPTPCRSCSSAKT